MGPSCFLSGPTKIQSLQNGEKMRKSVLDKIALLHSMANFLSFSTCLSDFFFFFFFRIKFCTVHIGSFCLFLSVFFFFNILLAFAYFINKLIN